VVLDTNAIDRQGGVVSVRLRRDDEAWGAPVPYYDSYRWSIAGDEGAHTFAAEFRDRADNVTVVTTTVTLTNAPSAMAQLATSDTLTATLRLNVPEGEAVSMRVSQDTSFGDASWQPAKSQFDWIWQANRPRIVYVQFQTASGVRGDPIPLGDDLKRIYLPLARH
jgi:hypothetical protein